MSFVPERSLDSQDWQSGFLEVLPTVETHARIRFRHLARERREEAVQEAVAAAFVSYGVLAARGRLGVAHAATLATFAVNHVNSRRHVGGSQDGTRDAMSPVAQHRHGFTTHRFGDGAGGGAGDGAQGGQWKQMTIVDRRASIPDVAAFRIDFARWLGSLSPRDQQIITGLISGETVAALAGQWHITPGRISQLRHYYERHWRLFQGEVGVAAAA